MRFKKIVNKFYKFSNWDKRLIVKLKNISGRSKEGFKIVRTKKHNYNNFNFLEKRSLSNSLGLILNLCFSIFQKTFFFFIKDSTNSYFYIRGIHGLFLGDYVKSVNLNPRIITSFFLGFEVVLMYCKKGSILSNIKINNKTIFIKSSGTYGQVVDLMPEFFLVTVKLPSSKKKIFSFNDKAVVGRNIFIDRKYQFFSKAGFLKNCGKSSLVRGVAMNPVDHPHGGRTKTNSPEVSLWGWVAKRSH